MDPNDQIDVAESTGTHSVHRVSTKYRWLTVLLVPPLVALMLWAIYESVYANLSESGDVQPWAVALSFVLFGGMTLVFLSAVVWAFRARVVIDGERMEVRGAYLTTVVTPDRMQGFRWVNGQIYVYLANRRFAVQIGWLDDMWAIHRWIEQRTADIVGDFLQDEAAEISADQGLGLTEQAKEEHLQSLRNIIRRINYAIYLVGGVGVANFLFVENHELELFAIGSLMLMPLGLYMLALTNRGHVRIDYDEGSRYPQIFTGTMSSGVVLSLVSLLDRGALLDTRFYELLAIGMLANGFLWLYIDRERLKILQKRSSSVLGITIVAMFIIPGAWVGGSLYQANKLFDQSPTTWHETVILDTKISTGRRTTSYSVELAPWDAGREEAVEYTLRRKEFEALESGMAVWVGVRKGAFGMRWASGLEPAPPPRSDGS